MRREDVVGRFGGEEFIILMSNTTRDTAAELQRKCVKLYWMKSLIAESDMLPITISIGIALFTDTDGPSPDVLSAMQTMHSMRQKRAVETESASTNKVTSTSPVFHTVCSGKVVKKMPD